MRENVWDPKYFKKTIFVNAEGFKLRMQTKGKKKEIRD